MNTCLICGTDTTGRIVWLNAKGEEFCEDCFEIGSSKRACDCGWKGAAMDILRAPDPFNEGCQLHACPKCRAQTLRTCCDEPDCWEPDTCGTPTPDRYRRTCHKHTPNA